MPLAKNGFKVCTKCSLELPVSAFSKNSRSSDLLQYWCKACLNTHKRTTYQDNPEPVRCSVRKYRTKNSEAIANRKKRQRRIDPDAERLIGARYRSTHRKLERQRHTLYRMWNKTMIEDLFTGDHGLALLTTKDSKYGTAAHRDRKNAAS